MEPSDEPGIECNAWSVLETAALPATATRSFCLGVTGSSFRTLASPLLYSDFASLALPGLRSLGIAAALQPLPDEPSKMTPALRDLNRGADCAVFRFGGEPVSEENWETEDEAEGRAARRDRERSLARQGLVVSADPETVQWKDAAGMLHVSAPSEFRTLFSFGMRLRAGKSRETRRVCLLAAIQRAVVYQLAFPDLALSDTHLDRRQREAAAEFLQEAAGRQRDPLALRWRQAAECLAHDNAIAAWERLYNASLRALNLPTAISQALRTDNRLSDIEIRELIYLARAGNRDLKVFAIHRLAQERDNRVIRQTLGSLAFYPDPRVRAAAHPTIII